MNDEPTADSSTELDSFSVSGWQVTPSTHRISKDGKSVKLEPRTMAVLVYLARVPGKAVTREKLEQEVWSGLVVGYDALSNTIAKLRKAFGDAPKHPTIIETIPKVGYRLIAAVSARDATPAEIFPVSDENLQRKLVAILYADVAGYSRLTGEDEDGTHRALSANLDLITASITRYGGRVVHFAGDAVLADFSTVSVALACAVTVQQEIAARNDGVPESRKVQFRIGVNLGEVIVDRDDIFGDGVNIAARLEGLAEPGGVCVSGAVFDAVGHKLPLEFRFLGEQTVKNIAKPVRAYHAQAKSGATLPAPVPAPPVVADSRRRILIAAVAVTVLLAAGALLSWLAGRDGMHEPRTTVQGSAAADKNSIAVLPFLNMSDQLAREYFADGLTDDLITDLSKLSGLNVIGRHSVFTYKDSPKSLSDIARELGVRYIVEGSVRGSGATTRINVKLIDTVIGRNLWAQRYDSDEADIFSLQDQVLSSIVSALAIKLTDTEKTRLARRPTNNLEAYDIYLRAERRRWSWAGGAQTQEATRLYRLSGVVGMRYHESLRLYREAIALDPEFADAYAGLAETAYLVWRWDNSDVLPGSVARKLAYESASRVVSLDPENPRAYGVLAKLQVTDGRHEAALDSARQALALDPNNAAAYTVLAEVLMYAGRHGEALDAMQSAFSLDPKPPPIFHAELGRVMFFNRRYSEAVEHLETAQHAGLEWRDELAMSYAEAGKLDEANTTLRRLYDRMPFANLTYYRTMLHNFKRREDLEHMIQALAKAGMPTWAYGYQPTVENKLDSDALEKLTVGRTWVGRVFAGDAFIQQFNEDGRVALKSRTSLLVGTMRIHDDMVCIQIPAALLGREDCGSVYRNPGGTHEREDEYARVALGEIYFFSTEP